MWPWGCKHRTFSEHFGCQHWGKLNIYLNSDVLPHPLLISSFLNHIPLLLLFNWVSFLHGINFCKAMIKASGKTVMASLSVSINVKVQCRYANNWCAAQRVWIQERGIEDSIENHHQWDNYQCSARWRRIECGHSFKLTTGKNHWL